MKCVPCVERKQLERSDSSVLRGTKGCVQVESSQMISDGMEKRCVPCLCVLEGGEAGWGGVGGGSRLSKARMLLNSFAIAPSIYSFAPTESAVMRVCACMRVRVEICICACVAAFRHLRLSGYRCVYAPLVVVPR